METPPPPPVDRDVDLGRLTVQTRFLSSLRLFLAPVLVLLLHTVYANQGRVWHDTIKTWHYLLSSKNN